jgi:hydrogenase maturation protease
VKSSTLVVGIGNPERGDDGIGPEIAARVAALGLPGVRVVTRSEPIALVSLLGGGEDLVVVDAIGANGSPGRIVITDQITALPRGCGLGSTHGFGLAEALDLAQALEVLPHRVVLVGVEGTSFDVGQPLSASVRQAATQAVREVLAQLR